MKIGSIEAKAGEKVFGYFAPVQSRGRFDAHIPLHIVRGAKDGPTLVVHSGISGLEIEPATELPTIIEDLDPKSMSGTLVLVPLLNTSGFEFEQKNAIWDDKDLNTLGRGDPSGTVSDQLIDAYFRQAIGPAQALLEIHTGQRWGYFRYAGVYKTGATDKSRALAAALGVPQVVLGQPADQSMAFEAAKDGKTVVSAWIGGGPGLRDYREQDMRRLRLAVLNAMRHLGILAGKPEKEEGPVSVLEGHTWLYANGQRGLTFVAKERRGQRVREGEQIAYVKHPFTGDVVEEIKAPRNGVLVHGGGVWPMMPDGVPLAILGDLVEEVK